MFHLSLDGGFMRIAHVTGEGVISYVGITSRDAAWTWAEHFSSDPLKVQLNWALVYGAVFTTKIEARIWEQTQINANGFIKNGGTLLNKINSIAQKYWKNMEFRNHEKLNLGDVYVVQKNSCIIGLLQYIGMINIAGE